MFKNIQIISNILKMLQEKEGITPSCSQFIRVMKDNPRFISMMDMGQYFRDGAISEIANNIRMLRGYW